MEPHPVPQNIIDVEFKLFGSFTLKQFGKILIGCLAALGIFALNIPEIIKYPLCLISVLLGIGLAIVNNLGTWISGFLKAVFFSPRYVWIKDASTPDVLKTKAQAAPGANQKVSSSMSAKKIDINDLAIDKLFGAKAQSKERDDVLLEDENPVKGKNFQRVYSDVFGAEPVKQIAKTAPAQPQSPTGLNKKEEYENEIQKLKFQLSMLAKDENYKNKEEEIISRINELYREIKVMDQDKQTDLKSTEDLRLKQKISQKLETLRGQVIMGIVVDKRDVPLPSVEITFVNREDKMSYKTKTSIDGKFSTGSELEEGVYDISLSDSKHRFHTYLITVGEAALPAYKFREK